MNLVAPVGARGVGYRDRDRVRGAVEICSHRQDRRKTVMTKPGSPPATPTRIGRPSPSLASESSVASRVDLSHRGVPHRRTYVFRADPVKPHLVSRETAKPHADRMLPTTAAKNRPRHGRRTRRPRARCRKAMARTFRVGRMCRAGPRVRTVWLDSRWASARHAQRGTTLETAWFAGVSTSQWGRGWLRRRSFPLSCLFGAR
jgi:hypothetical protein